MKLKPVLIGAGALIASLAAAAGGIYLYAPVQAVAYWQNLTDPVAPPQPVVWQAGPEKPPEGARKPNIIVIMADDLGFNDITAFGGGLANGRVATPAIDSLARDGVAFMNGYSGHATCAPSRAALMTGRFPSRFGFQFNNIPRAIQKFAFDKAAEREGPKPIAPAIFHEAPPDDGRPQADQGLPASEITLPQLLKSAGYRTLMVGKWHLGATKKLEPGARGFDEWLGILSGSALYGREDSPDIVSSNTVYGGDFAEALSGTIRAVSRPAVRKDFGKPFEVPRYMTDFYGDEAVAAIKANRNRPFFLYLAFNAPHTPLMALKSDFDALDYIPDRQLRIYAAMVKALDRNVGKVLEALKSEGLDRDTLVVFTSDNGAPPILGLGDLNKPYRGWKSTFFEGGIHVPYLVRWTGKIPAGGRNPVPVANIDLFSTALAVAGTAGPVGRVIDGVDIMPLATGTGPAPERPLFWRSGGYRAVSAGGWKLQISDPPGKSWLFHLADDPTEQKNLIAAEPAKADELKALLTAYEKEQAPPLWPLALEKAVRIDVPGNVAPAPDQEFIYWAN